MKEKILEAAEDQFAELGYDGARMDRIAKVAGVNKASIYYNIGNKKKLYAAVLNRSFEQGWGGFGAIVASDQSAEEKLAAYVENWGRALTENPIMHRIMMREQIDQGRNLPESFVGNIVKILDSLSAILAQGVEEDVFEVCDTVTIHFMIFASMVFHMTSAPIRRSKKGFGDRYQPETGVLPEGVVERISRHILKAVRK